MPPRHGAPERTTIDFRTVPHVFGVPRYLYRKALATAASAVWKTLRGDAIGAFEDEVWVWFFAGIVRQRWTDSRSWWSGPEAAISGG